MKKVFMVVMMLAAAMVIVACGSSDEKNTPKNAMSAEFEGAPQWVLKGGSSSPKEICSIGSTGGTKSASIGRTAAIERGRTELARMLSSKVQAMIKDYQSTTTGGEDFGAAANDEQHIVDVAKQITDTALSGTEQKDSWISNSGTFYALVCMDLEKFSGVVNNMGQLREGIRKAVVERSEKAFEELAKEIENQNR